MVRMLLTLALATLLAGPLMAQANTTKDAEKPADKAAPDPAADKEKDNKKVDKYLDIDWGTDKPAEKVDDPDARQPANKVDLATALDEAQKKRLDVVLKAAAKGDELVAKAVKASSGEDKHMKKIDAVQFYHNAGVIYRKAVQDLETLSKAIKDEDTRLTFLREHRDGFKAKACEMFCKAAQVIIEEAKTLADLKRVGLELQQARQADKDNPLIATTLEAARKAVTDMQIKLQEASAKQGGGGMKKQEDDVKNYDDGRQVIDPSKTGRDDYKRTGRP